MGRAAEILPTKSKGDEGRAPGFRWDSGVQRRRGHGRRVDEIVSATRR